MNIDRAQVNESQDPRFQRGAGQVFQASDILGDELGARTRRKLLGSAVNDDVAPADRALYRVRIDHIADGALEVRQRPADEYTYLRSLLLRQAFRNTSADKSARAGDKNAFPGQIHTAILVVHQHESAMRNLALAS
jgi:hypothetical protein